MGNRFARPIRLRESEAEVVEGFRIIRPHRERALEVGDGGREPGLVGEQLLPEIVVRDPGVRIARKRGAIKCRRVAVDLGLLKRQTGERDKAGNSRARAKSAERRAGERENREARQILEVIRDEGIQEGKDVEETEHGKE